MLEEVSKLVMLMVQRYAVPEKPLDAMAAEAIQVLGQILA